jgi:predicted O-methyltransferase YrrM
LRDLPRLAPKGGRAATGAAIGQAETESRGEARVEAIYRSDDWNEYRMDYRYPHRELEPVEKEIEVVEAALEALARHGVLAHTRYDQQKMLAHRRAVQEHFEIPWTAITPRMQRLLYAINAVSQPANMIAAGVFCGNTFISNAGAAVGPGACYQARQLLGVEIRPEEAARAERNVRRIDRTGKARVVAGDAVEVVADFPEEIHLLYLDADGDARRGKGIYLDILKAGLDRMPAGSLILAHNSVNGGPRLQPYLDFVRNPDSLRASVNVVIDGEGLEVSAR